MGSLRTGRAPGFDRVDAGVVKMCTGVLTQFIHQLMVDCLRSGYFPSAWKIARVCAFLKAGRPVDLPGSYRMISLLSVLGKTLEQLILARLQFALGSGLHPGQFGGVPGRSKSHAAREIADLATNSTSRYVVAIFFISRHLDNDICALVSNYLNDRRVILPEYGRDCERQAEMGIPQGSVLGPFLWSLLFDGALRKLVSAGLNAVAYVDGLAVVIHANTKAGIEAQGRTAVAGLTGWCRRVKLSLAPEKAPPVVTYSGVKMSTGLKFGANARYTREKIPARVAVVRAMCGAAWGVSYRSRQIYYSALCQSVLLYAAPAWVRGLRAADWAIALSAQRTALLAVTQAFRTTSTDALQVIAGRPPLDLQARALSAAWEVANGGQSSRRRTEVQRLKEVCDQFPDEKVVGFYEFIRPALVIKDAEYVEAVLIKDFPHFVDHGFDINETTNPLDVNLFTMTGKRWRAYRNKLSPIFTTVKLKSMYGLMTDIANNLMKAIDREKTECLELKDVLGRFSMDVIGSFAFGMDANTLADPESKFRKMGKKTFDFNFKQFLKFMFISNFPEFSKKYGQSFSRKDVQHYFVNVIKDTIDYRVEKKVRRNDFLDLMLQLREKGSVEITTKDPSDDYPAISNETYTTDKFEVTDDLMVGQAFVFLTAGFEATAIIMNMTFYQLSKNPGIQERVREEINEKVREYGSLSFDSVKDMTYLDMCLKETMRMYPPAQVLFRTCTKEYTFSNGLVVKPGEKLIIPVFAIHRSGEYYPDPMRFDPERFGPDVFQRPCTFLPFGEGPRGCIAMRFAIQQMKFGLAKALMSYKIKVNPKTKEPIELNKKSLVTTTKYPIYIDLEVISS
ncbi:probable cytochrome P450 6a14 [Cimex lectularius]|uniref:Reverse transcriptase domain-containing protein n=1 Tax=Cimex lectularius TaxID=79782 RepID=A0A8I6TLR5_CIMLE|nr:probable cytochrome P450 6a14 [Cimex lectularius]